MAALPSPLSFPSPYKFTTPFINGRAIEVAEDDMVEVCNPATGKAFAKVFMGRPEHMKAAIDAADVAKPAWGKATPAEREQVLLRAADVLESMRNQAVDLLIDEAGSTMGKAQMEVSVSVGLLRAAAGEARRVFGQTMPSDTPGMVSMAIRKPLGVVGCISPFNFPLILSLKKIGFILAAGNTCVLKPSEETSLVSLLVADVFDKAGLPAGVLNIVPGDGPSLGEVLLHDPRVRMISFTGSTQVGRMIAVECAKQGKKVLLEMGGKSPLVVLKDADLDYAVETACFGMFMHQGQVCMAGSRVIVEEPVYEQFLDKFARKVKGLKVGDPRDPKTVIGPLIRTSQCGFIQQQIASSCEGGARILCGGKSEGNFFEPTIVADVRPEQSIFQRELFGPVVCVSKANDADDALALANRSSYGLSSAVLTNDLQRAMQFAEALESGMVHINGPTIHDEPHVPFGGVKDSGSGREGGQWSMEQFTEEKWVTIQVGKRQYPF